MKGDTHIYVDERTLREYFVENFKDVKGKGYEISAAVMLKNFFEKECGVPCLIGFKIKDKYEGYYSKRSGIMTVADIKTLLEMHKDEDSSTDLVISPITTFRGNKNAAWVIQLKRFGYHQHEKDTNGLIKMLENIAKKYSPSSAFLVILFDGHQGISLKKTRDHFMNKNFPFSRLLFINPNQDEQKDWFVDIGEILPGYGYNRYRASELVAAVYDHTTQQEK
jgi:hypothetical protein